MVNVEIYLNTKSFRQELSKFIIEDEKDGWILARDMSNETYLAREFKENYAILLYPRENIEEDLIRSFSNEVPAILKLKEVIYLPERWNDRIDLKIDQSKLETTSSLNLDCITGLDLINSLVKEFRFKQVEDVIVIELEIKRPLSTDLLNHYIINLYNALKIYYKIKKAQEEIITKLILDYKSD
jgi:hypothetical protein